jgi:flagellar basal-body rod modification protein FlgD
MSAPAMLPPVNANSSSPPPSSSGASSAQGLNSMFMQLLMAQLKNQSPLTPMDPTQFVGQLAQFSQLSSINSIYTLLQQLVPGGSGSVPAGASSPANGGSSKSTGADAGSPQAVSQSFLSPVSPATAIIPDLPSPALNSLIGKIQGGF